ncbi:hypothetical protein RIF29_11083 [Crotalaria pallida]|uniref:RING-type domain-containing protein n=1 Tax=Crotalaria pallida TaxID=3830 RepID=A0AAN9FVW1_CROPI
MDDKMCIKVEKNLLESCLNCPICHNQLNETTANPECIHIFCKKFVEDQITEVGIESCHVCEVGRGSDPLKKMRTEDILQSLRDIILSEDKKIVEATKVDSTPSMTKGLGEEMMSLSSFSSMYKSSSPLKDSQEGVELEGLDSPKTSSSSTLKLNASNSKTKITSSQEKELARGRSSQSSHQEHGAAKTKPLEDESIWIVVKASENQEGVPLPPITPTCYMKIKDGSLKILGIRKYVQNKLGLESEEEIEIKCMEETLPFTMEITDVYQSWLNSKSSNEIIVATVGYGPQLKILS